MNHKTLCLTLSLTNLQKSFKYIHRSRFCTFLILYYLRSMLNSNAYFSLELICKACKIKEIYDIEICQPSACSIGMHQTYFA